ncbi:hypothetical protein [Rheinheimera pleomorphica]|uniref:hypothetical protein n=1 Tax=Rheinheimera pleomorphica TaxID=2703963 RepID=UPI0014247208|nr:hypothetical protein [Rheinheimera pleomorphica]
MSYKGLVNGGSALILSLLASCSSVANAAAADHEVGYFCKNCSYQEAVELAKQNAVPNMSCRISSTPMEDYVETCYSQPKRYYVLNETNRRLNGFTVKHSNQGKMRHELQVVVERRNLSRDHTTLILEALDAKQLLARNLAKAAGEFSDVIDTSSRSAKSSYTLNNIKTVAKASGSDPKANCANDPHSQALSDALNPFYADGLTRQLKDHIRQGIRSGEYENQEEALSKFNFGLTGLNVSASINRRTGPDVAISASWGMKEKSSTYFDHEYISVHDHSTSSLRWLASVEGGEVKLSLSQFNSFVGGISVGKLLGGSTKFKISLCVARALADAFPANTFEKTTKHEDIMNWTGPYPIIGNDWGRPEQSDRGWICEYFFKNHTGAKIAGFSFLGRCP